MKFNASILTSGGFALLGAVTIIHGINYSFAFELGGLSAPKQGKADRK